jgi:hypothetical protein
MLSFHLGIAKLECHNGGFIAVALPSYVKAVVSGSHNEMGQVQNARTCRDIRRFAGINYTHTKCEDLGALHFARLLEARMSKA